MRARPSPLCNLIHAWLLEGESNQLDDPRPYCAAKGLEVAFRTIPGVQARHVIGKGGSTL